MKETPPARWQLVVVLGLGVAAVSTAAVFVRLVLTAAGSRGPGISLMIAAARLSLASVVLAPVWLTVPWRSLPRRGLAYSLAAGVLLALHFAVWITSLSYTSIAASATLVATSPLWIVLLNWVGKQQRPHGGTLLGIGLALLGSAVIYGGSTGQAGVVNPLLGNGLALLGAWLASGYLLLGQAAQRRGLAVQQHVVLAYGSAAAVLLPLPLLWGVGYGGYGAGVYLGLLGLALIPQVVGHTSFNWAVRWVSPTVVTLVILGEPIGASLLAVVLLGEVPGPWVGLGAGLLVGGIALASGCEAR